MLQIPLDAVPNQSVIFYIGNDRYVLTIKESASGSVLTSVTRNDLELVSNIVCVFGTPVLPYIYMEQGNFVFMTTNDDLPNWRLFGTTHNLFYMTIEEVELARVG